MEAESMDAESPPLKMDELLREYAEFLRQSNDEAAKRMVTHVEGILEATDDSGRSTPHFAAVGGCLPILQLSINHDKTAANRPDELGWTPLMIASSAGRVEVVRYLLSLPQVDVNHRNVNRQTALHYATSKNHREIAHLLLEAGADVNASDKYGATPLHRAASQGHDKVRSSAFWIHRAYLLGATADKTIKNKGHWFEFDRRRAVGVERTMLRLTRLTQVREGLRSSELRRRWKIRDGVAWAKSTKIRWVGHVEFASETPASPTGFRGMSREHQNAHQRVGRTSSRKP
ncbi:unnamed protein product [Heligmosomoides polygyrus]|uniref:ANK_REP_REGION domain-containing protein n=1 Tax=Heligmosomoides polygyrus TaxID=6339 RepID=A0A3P8E9C4_HELPZ|nr:unnamed protein product [Heligmosomoides polygyrus]